MFRHFRFCYVARDEDFKKIGEILNVRERNVSNVNKELYEITYNIESTNKIICYNFIL
jgi:hypothetical protein